MATLTTPREEERPTRLTDYRPHLDGLRAIAVYLVVAFHSEIGRLSGGFIGVDVFFVLSGYLVTQLLLRDLGSFDRVRLRRFYARRYRRLLPAAFVALSYQRSGLLCTRATVAGLGLRRVPRRVPLLRTGTSSTSRPTTSRPTSTAAR